MNGYVEHIGRNWVVQVGAESLVFTRKDKALVEARELIAESGGGTLSLYWKGSHSLEFVPAAPPISDSAATVVAKLSAYLDLRGDDTSASDLAGAEYDLARALDDFRRRA